MTGFRPWFLQDCELAERVSQLPNRIKGFVRTTDGVKNVSLVGEKCRMEDWDQPVDETRLVIISSTGIRIMSETLKAARDCYQNPISVE